MSNVATTISSSSTLWATASKEWVIPAKPKPGRKPKKDNVQPAGDDQEDLVDSKGRRVQNRAAQRAFRERKQSQLADLQARIQMYEQGEIERNVALQNIAKRLKEENETLRTENVALKERINKLEAQRDSTPDIEKKRSRDFSPSSSSSVSDRPTRKRSRGATSSDKCPSRTASQAPSFTSSLASTPELADTFSRSIRVDRDSLHSPILQHHPPSLANLLIGPATVKSTDFDMPFECGLCDEQTHCVCAEIAIQQVTQEAISLPDSPTIKSLFEDEVTLPMDTPIAVSVPTDPTMSILDNLPAYQPPVPLRRKNRHSRPQANPLFEIYDPSRQQVKASQQDCTGDPSNCGACADDSFGKAFCTAIGQSAETISPCPDCPDAHVRGVNGCCGDLANCFCGAATSAALGDPSSSRFIPTSDAWRAIKAHPNVAFADLSLLADVVARRSKCNGPSVVINPALGSVTPDREVSLRAPAAPMDNSSVVLTDPHAHYREKQMRRTGSSPPPRLVPEEVLIRCGRRRIREVQSDAVREVLRLLDAKFAQS